MTEEKKCCLCGKQENVEIHEVGAAFSVRKTWPVCDNCKNEMYRLDSKIERIQREASDLLFRIVYRKDSNFLNSDCDHIIKLVNQIKEKV